MIGPEILCHTEKIAPGTATTGFTAALAARGKSKINNIEYILRGYENLDKKLKNIGAKIKIEK